jgi:RNA polymerase-binding transcription factor DksA
MDTMSSDEQPVAASAPLDLDAIERDLADVEVALARLDDGTYWTDEVTGVAIPHDVLAQRPTARRAAVG